MFGLHTSPSKRELLMAGRFVIVLALKVKLLVRRPITQLVEQGIIPRKCVGYFRIVSLTRLWLCRVLLCRIRRCLKLHVATTIFVASRINSVREYHSVLLGGNTVAEGMLSGILEVLFL